MNMYGMYRRRLAAESDIIFIELAIETASEVDGKVSGSVERQGNEGCHLISSSYVRRKCRVSQSCVVRV